MITKAIISKKLAEELNISLIEAKDITNTFINILAKSLKMNDVKLSKFGTFERKMSVKRVGRNPKTKECYIIAPRRRLFLKASNKIKKILN